MTRRSKQLSAEDRVLWGRVARSVDALPGRMEDLLAEESLVSDGNAKSVAPAKPAAAQRSLAEKGQASQKRKPASGGLNPIDNAVYRKLARGRLPLEASLDLHGLTQHQAYGLLHGFLARARQKGLRHVLVITGKGRSSGSEGALRRAVPEWLKGPEMKSMASGYEAAPRHHGGEGALYVRLRRLESGK